MDMAGKIAAMKAAPRPKDLLDRSWRREWWNIDGRMVMFCDAQSYDEVKRNFPMYRNATLKPV